MDNILSDQIADIVKKVIENIEKAVFEKDETALKNMLIASQKGFINATDLADYMVKKGMPFRSAYKIVGKCNFTAPVKSLLVVGFK